MDDDAAALGTELVLECLAGARHGEIVAVWMSGEITLEEFSFLGRRTPDGWERPVAEFISTGTLPPRDIVRLRLVRSFAEVAARQLKAEAV